MSAGQGRYVPLLFLMTLLFGGSFVATKIALEGLGVFQVVLGRYALAFLVILAVFWRKRHYFFIPREDWKHFLLLTAIEPIGYFIFETYGVRLTSPSNVALIIATIPGFAVIFAVFLLNERPTRKTLAGIALSFVGVYVIVQAQQTTALAPHPLLGSLFTLGAAMCAGLYNSLARRLTRRYHPITLTFYQSLVATFFFFPLALGELWLGGEPVLNQRVLISLLYLSLGSSVLGYFLLNYGLSRLGASRVAIFSNFIPVVTIFVSYLIFGDMLRRVQFVGTGLILIGIYLTYRYTLVPDEPRSAR
ncbi:MAG: DMT family transporter [Calditrichaeota bacterium]|nr:DMT family transporter [Calditrichota bacterium]